MLMELVGSNLPELKMAVAFTLCFAIFPVREKKVEKINASQLITNNALSKNYHENNKFTVFICTLWPTLGIL